MADRADVYFNLHRKQWSVRVGGRVVDHAWLVCLQDCTFVVQPAGRKRVRETGVKNVHAFVRGTRVIMVPPEVGAVEGARVRYDPYVNDSFVTIDDVTEDIEPIQQAQYVVMEIVNRRPRVRAWREQQ